jgi:hypothetical protein
MEHRPRWGRKSRRGRPFTSDGVRIIASKPRIGRIKLAVRREFIISNGRPITIRQVLQRGYPRLRRFTAWHYLAARRALRIEATVIARCRYGRGRPNLWVPRDVQTRGDKTSSR